MATGRGGGEGELLFQFEVVPLLQQRFDVIVDNRGAKMRAQTPPGERGFANGLLFERLPLRGLQAFQILPHAALALQTLLLGGLFPRLLGLQAGFEALVLFFHLLRPLARLPLAFRAAAETARRRSFP